MVSSIDDQISEGHARWRELAREIPCIPKQHDDVETVIAWGSARGRSDMERQAAAFLAYVWSWSDAMGTHKGLPTFDAMEVAAKGDERFRVAVAKFIADPFWP